NFFLEVRVAFDCRNSHLLYQNCLLLSSAFLFSQLLFRRPTLCSIAAAVIYFIRTARICQALFSSFSGSSQKRCLR
ncbi:MAG: hypothetical protein Q4C65_10620, partial [Eubacteriales bacterium]|nr:hypothetical protein [Eubacteriales bacterium]